MSALPGTKPEHAAEHDRFLSHVEEHREQVPCVDTPDALRWVSEDQDEQREAAAACRSCPLLTPCRAFAVRNGETGGTWGGLTPGQLTTQHRHYKAALEDLGATP